MLKRLGIGSQPTKEVAITSPQVAPTTTQENKQDTKKAIYNLKTRIINGIQSTNSPQVGKVIQELSEEIYNKSFKSRIDEEIKAIITQLYTEIIVELKNIDPSIDVTMFDTDNIQLPEKISEVFQIKTDEYIKDLERFYFARIKAMLDKKFELLQSDKPVAPISTVIDGAEADKQAAASLIESQQDRLQTKRYINTPANMSENTMAWARYALGGGGNLSQFSKKRRKPRKKRRVTKKSKKKLNI